MGKTMGTIGGVLMMFVLNSEIFSLAFLLVLSIRFAAWLLSVAPMN